MLSTRGQSRFSQLFQHLIAFIVINSREFRLNYGKTICKKRLTQLFFNNTEPHLLNEWELWSKESVYLFLHKLRLVHPKFL